MKIRCASQREEAVKPSTFHILYVASLFSLSYLISVTVVKCSERDIDEDTEHFMLGKYPGSRKVK